ncbi:MAG: hypothetical protein IKP75_10125 [Oscillospiraceae bacterium]|nr:hypothetical protein [Oscillospiraceae bacterium]
MDIDFKDYTEKDIHAIQEKAFEPTKDVKCPRCGSSLIFHEFGSAYEVKCPTDGCLHETARGL